MKENINKAEKLLKNWKKENYIFGVDVLKETGRVAKEFGNKTILIITQYKEKEGEWLNSYIEEIMESLKKNGVEHPEPVKGARPNAPREDLYRIALSIAKENPDSIIAVGGGSTIDATKAASVLVSYPANEIDQYFGTGEVTKVLNETKKTILPVIAIQTAASSGAHLTKYSNITDPINGIKKLIVDPAIVPPKAIFDYKVTLKSPISLTLDGALDAISHCLEVFMGGWGKSYYNEIKEITETAICLIIEYLPKVIKRKDDLEARAALGLATDLGGYAIMISKLNPKTGKVEAGGTNAAHLGSFQLIHYLSHGRACALLNPYYIVLFAKAIEEQNRVIGKIFKEKGFIDSKVNLEKVKGRKLAEIVAKGMIKFSKSIGFPTTLKESGVPEKHIKNMVAASKDPQLKMKLQNMPTPMEVEKGDIDNLMKPTLKAAYSGDLKLIP
jgi:alcohol dehydrogenase class IV